MILTDADIDQTSPFLYDYEENNEVVKVEPLFNRMVIFNASKWHRVETKFTGKRYTFAVNANRHRPKVLTKD